NNLNTYRPNGKIITSFEEVFGNIDYINSILFKKFHETNIDEDIEITSVEKFHILHFVSILYWRLPNSNKTFTRLIEKEGLSNTSWGFRSILDNSIVPDEKLKDIKKQFLEEEEIQNFFKHTIPLSQAGMD